MTGAQMRVVMVMMVMTMQENFIAVFLVGSSGIWGWG